MTDMNTSGPTRASRIPGTEPFTVRFLPSRAHTMLRWTLLAAAALTLGLIGGAATIGLTVAAPDDRLALLLSSAFCGGTIVFSLLVVARNMWPLATGEPLLAVGPDGIWTRTRMSGPGAVWLPWSAVAQISMQQVGTVTALRIQPVDPHAGGRRKAPRAGYVTATRFTDKSADEIAAAITHFSAARCPLGWQPPRPVTT